MKKKKGFTLVEMIAVIAIIGITGVLVFTLFGKTHKIFTSAEKESISVDEVRMVMSTLEEDIRLADKGSNIYISKNGEDIKSISIKIDSKDVLYEKNSYTIIRTKNGTKITLGKNIEKLNVDQEGGEYTIKVYVSSLNKINNDEPSFQTIVTRRK